MLPKFKTTDGVVPNPPPTPHTHAHTQTHTLALHHPFLIVAIWLCWGRLNCDVTLSDCFHLPASAGDTLCSPCLSATTQTHRIIGVSLALIRLCPPTHTQSTALMQKGVLTKNGRKYVLGFQIDTALLLL